MSGWTPASLSLVLGVGHYHADSNGTACGYADALGYCALAIAPLPIEGRGRVWFWRHAVLSPDLYDLRTADEEEAKRLATLAAHAAVDRLKAALPPLPEDPACAPKT